MFEGSCDQRGAGMKLIQNAGILWHKLWTVRLSIVSTIYSTAAGTWAVLPYAWQPTLSEPVKWVLAAIGVILAASPAVARMIHQPQVAAIVAETNAKSCS